MQRILFQHDNGRDDQYNHGRSNLEKLESLLRMETQKFIELWKNATELSQE